MNVLREETVGADHDVGLAVFQERERLVLLLLRLETRQHLERDRVVAHPRLEGAVVLLREHGRRTEDRDLLAAHRDAERRPERDLGLAEADVSADEAIHRARSLEVAVHLFDRARLIVGLVERERRLEGAVVVVRGLDRVAGLRLALGVEAEELVRHLADGLLHAGLRLRERHAAEAIDLRLSRLTAGEFLDLVEAIDREVELVAPGVFDHEQIDGEPADVTVDETGIPTDAVLDVDDVVADVQAAEVLDERPRRIARPLLAGAVRSAAEDLLLGHDRVALAREDHTASERTDDHLGVVIDASALREPGRIEAGDAHAGREALVLEERGETFGLRLRAGGEEDAEPALLEVDDASSDRRERVRLPLRRPRGLHRSGDVRVIGGRQVDRLVRGLERREAFAGARDRRAVEGDDATLAELEGSLVLGEEVRGDDEARLLRLRGVVLLGARELVANDAREIRRRREHHASVVRDVVPERRELLVVRREKPVGAEERSSGRDVVDEDPRLHRRPIDHVGQVRDPSLGAIDEVLRENGVASRREPDLGEARLLGLVRLVRLVAFVALVTFAREGARRLRHRVERLDRHDEIAVELDARGLGRAWCPHIEQRSANGERPRVLDDGYTEPTGVREITHDAIAIELLLVDDPSRMRLESGRRNELAHEGRRRDDEHTPGTADREMRERRHAHHRAAPVRVHVGIRRRLGHRQHEHVARVLEVTGATAATEQERDVTGETSGGVGVLGDHDRRGCARVAYERSDDRSVGGATDVGHVDPRVVSRGDRGEARDDHPLGRKDGGERIELFRRRPDERVRAADVLTDAGPEVVRHA